MQHRSAFLTLFAALTLAACSSSESSTSNDGSAGHAGAPVANGGSSSGGHAGSGAGSSALGGSSAAASGGNPGAGGSSGSNGGGGAATGGSSSGAAGLGGAGPVVCPTAAPFDAEAPGIREQCTRKVYVAAGAAIRRLVAFDTPTDFGHEVLDAQDGTHQDEHMITGVAVGKGVIVATGDGGVLTSTDGETWTRITNLPDRIHASRVIFAQDRFFVVGSNGTWTSSDAVTWTGAQNDELLPGNVKASFTGHVGSVAAGAGKVVFGGDNSALRIFDGTNWSDGKVGNYSGWLSNLAFGAGSFVVTGDACCNAPLPTSEGLSATSPDGLAWSHIVTNATAGVTGRRFGALLWTGANFYATGTQYGDTGYTSPDGITWTELKLDHDIGPAVYYEGEYFGSSGASLYTSADGLKWTVAHQGADSDYGFGALAIGRILKH